ncbi:monocarboxylate transporter 10-like [Lytechinus variegatus]|uniref:monocarboxylate transporter 10-like n=2 Tax=Lytechinus variegatus TaxID=7654 RepID=UPI001BB2B9E1|nr:monocarboxylate transporter 10-like [Lytechinus variegatus]
MTAKGKAVEHKLASRDGVYSKQDDVDFKNPSAKRNITCKALWEDPTYFRWISTFIWASVSIFNFGIIGDFSMFFIYIEEDLRASVMELNWLGSLPWILFSVCSPLTTPIVKVLGYRYTLVGSNLVCAIGLFATSFPHQIWPMYLTYSLVFGGSTIIYYTAGCIYVTGYFDQKSCTGPVSSMGFFYEIAVLVFSPIIQVTADAWGWRWSVRLLSSCTLVCSGLLVIFIRQPPLDLSGRVINPVTNDEDQGKEAIDVHEPCLATTKDTEANDAVTTSRERYIKMISMPSFWVFELSIMLSFTALSFSNINLGSYLYSVGISTGVTAILHSSLAGGGVLGRSLVMFLSHKLPVPISSIYPIIAILNCFLSILILITSSLPVLYIYSTAVGFLRALYFSLATGLAVELFGITNAAQGYVGLFFAYGIAGVLAAVLPGITHGLTGSYTVTVITCAVFWGISFLLFAVVYLLYRRRQKRGLEAVRISAKSQLRVHSDENYATKSL